MSLFRLFDCLSKDKRREDKCGALKLHKCRSKDVVATLGKLMSLHGVPRYLCSDNGPEAKGGLENVTDKIGILICK